MSTLSVASRRLEFPALCLALLAACHGDSDGTRSSGPPATTGPAGALELLDTDADGDGDGIVDLPGSVPRVIGDLFARYTAIEVGGGRRVHLLAQSGVDDRKLTRAREVMRQHLRDAPGTSLGADKSAVASAMGTHGATLALFRDAGAAEPSQPMVAAFAAAFQERVWGLLATQVIVEGSPEYHAASPAIDNTFGATAALLHRTGFRYAAVDHYRAGKKLMEDDLAAGVFSAPSAVPATERDELWVGLALDVHSGVFGHDPLGNGQATNLATYPFHDRASMAAGAPMTLEWVEAFFAPQHDYRALVHPDFDGTFDCRPDAGAAYTQRSQYLRRIELTGSNDSSLAGPDASARLTGNAGDNQLRGRQGSDHLDGGAGIDTAHFTGARADYIITMDGGAVIVTDQVPGRDDGDRLEGIERLQFADELVEL